MTDDREILRAMFDAAVAAACLEVEGAVDPIMLPKPAEALWASRRAEAVRRLPPPPPMEIVGGFFGPAERTRAEDDRFPDIADLAAEWEAGARRADLAALAAVASASGARTAALRGPAGDPTEALAKELGALGWLRAHTGSARGLIFPPGRAPDRVEARLRDAGFSRVIRFSPAD